MDDTATLATAPHNPLQLHPILNTLRSDVAALAAEAIKLRDKQFNQKFR